MVSIGAGLTKEVKYVVISSINPHGGTMKTIALFLLGFTGLSSADEIPWQQVEANKSVPATIRAEVRALDKDDQKLITDIQSSIRYGDVYDLKKSQRQTFLIHSRRHRALWAEIVYLARRFPEIPDCPSRTLWFHNRAISPEKTIAECEITTKRKSHNCHLGNVEWTEINSWAHTYLAALPKNKYACK